MEIPYKHLWRVFAVYFGQCGDVQMGNEELHIYLFCGKIKNHRLFMKVIHEMKKQTLFLLFIITLFLCSCSFKNENIKDDFMNYNKEQLENHIFTTSMNTEIVIVDIEKENTSHNPRVILTVTIGNSDVAKKTYQWLQLSHDERKADLKECGDMVVKYAQDNNWSNDYYLYVKVCQIYDGCNIVYDYEHNVIWLPKCENTFTKMYEKFNTIYKKELEETQEGIDFLVENDLAHIKHNQVVYKSNISYNVYISDGEFESYGEEDSVKY